MSAHHPVPDAPAPVPPAQPCCALTYPHIHPDPVPIVPVPPTPVDQVPTEQVPALKPAGRPRRRLSPLAKRRMIVASALLLLAGLAWWFFFVSEAGAPYVGAVKPYYDQAKAFTDNLTGTSVSDVMIGLALVIIPHIGMLLMIFDADR